MNLSKRLEAILELIPDNSKLVDVGTDHGLLVIKAVQQGKAQHAYALDIAPLPLNQAKTNVDKYSLNTMITLELRDGLNGFNHDADCYVLAGMGAETIWMILKNYIFRSSDTIIIQSNTKIPWLRETLAANSFEIMNECYLIDRDIPTFIIVVQKREDVVALSNVDKWIGPILKNQKNKEFSKYLSQRVQHLETIHHHDSKLHEEFETIKEILYDRKENNS